MTTVGSGFGEIKRQISVQDGRREPSKSYRIDKCDLFCGLTCLNCIDVYTQSFIHLMNL